MASNEINPRGPFDDEDLDPIIFVESSDTPEMREAVENIPRPKSDDSYAGPKIGRREKLEDQLNEIQYDSNEWVPNLEVSEKVKSINLILEIVAKLILAAIPITLAALFIFYSANKL